MLAVNIASAASSEEDTSSTRKQDWVAQEHFQVTRDVSGLHFPSAIAFVPNPGNEPKDPLYFVTELRGKVKVVTNDRSVYTFADLADDSFAFEPQEELPSGYGQGGLAGLCLAPQQGYVFATFLYRDKKGQLRNNIVRYRAEPETFSRHPTTKRYFTELFEPYNSGLAHQIGPCEVRGNQLYVSVGEAWQPYLTQELDTFIGKILRMSFDGQPIPSNPFYRDDGTHEASDYVWAYGLRNPYSLELVGDRLFAADNGHAIDRFLEIQAGENYLYDGSDRSIATRADYVWNTAVGPVQMDFLSSEAAIFPSEYGGSFFVALSEDGVYRLKYDFEKGRMGEVPGYFIRYRGDESRFVTGLGIGPDGLYFTSIKEEGGDQMSSVFKVSYDSTLAASPKAAAEKDGLELMREHGCVGCHTINGNWGFGGGTGPDLERGKAMVDRIRPRISSPEYETVLKRRIASAEDSAEVAFLENAREEILSAEKVDRVRRWLTHYLQEPGFDQAYNPPMPDVNLSEAEAAAISDYLLAGAGNGGVDGFVESTLPEPAAQIVKRIFPRRASRIHLVMLFIGGVLIGALGYSASSYTWNRIRTNNR